MGRDAVLFSPVLGALSDRFGRRPIILLSNFGLGLDYIVMAIAPTVWWLFLGRVISGITAASFSTASAYIADVAPPEKARRRLWHDQRGVRTRLRAGPGARAACSATSIRGCRSGSRRDSACSTRCTGYSCCRNRCHVIGARRLAGARANPLGSFKLLRSHAELFGLSAVNFSGSIAHEAMPTTFVLYAMYRYGWSERMVGLAIATVGVCCGRGRREAWCSRWWRDSAIGA